MAKKNKRNPLNKRYLREFKHDLGKYIVIFALMIITIGLCSGFKIADDSIIKEEYQSILSKLFEASKFKELLEYNTK